ncbi:MAG: PDZ domain-containing protein [Phycisphaera sp.]|nr:PDZ domain-containing protein [Phycisphaera sp.]
MRRWAWMVGSWMIAAVVVCAVAMGQTEADEGGAGAKVAPPPAAQAKEPKAKRQRAKAPESPAEEAPAEEAPLVPGFKTIKTKPTIAGDDTPGWHALTPDNVSDLKEMEHQVRSLLPAAQAATVGIDMGVGRGSGVIVTPDGLVMTAGHVSGEPNRACGIDLPDGTRVAGRTLGLYRRLDAGMVQILAEPPAGGWPCVPIAHSDRLVNGEWCFSLGHLGGFDKARGAVLRIGRVIRSRVTDVWTDCTLLGGDSGGPLFNMAGEVIGIHSRIAQSTEANLHIPSEVYIKHWDALAAGKTVDVPSGFMGVGTEGHPRGVRITQVVEGSPADKAGLKVGDVIASVDGHAIESREHFAWLVAARDAGDTVKLEIDKDGNRRTVSVTLDARPGQLGANDGVSPNDQGDGPGPGDDGDGNR